MSNDAQQMRDLKFIILPGLGGNKRMFADLKAAFPNIITPNWIEPEKGESLESYAARFIKTLKPDEPYLLGGASFGGMIAVEIARLKKPQMLFLLGSARASYGISPISRFILATMRILPTPVLKRASIFALSLYRYVPVYGRHADILREMVQEVDTTFLHWGMRAITSWKGNGSIDVPVVAIHGSWDRLLSARRARANHIIPKAGHVPTITHADEVSQILRQYLLPDSGE
jgi:pimeloyl-ACP methyl ester carboxylesterase